MLSSPLKSACRRKSDIDSNLNLGWELFCFFFPSCLKICIGYLSTSDMETTAVKSEGRTMSNELMEQDKKNVDITAVFVCICDGRIPAGSITPTQISSIG